MSTAETTPSAASSTPTPTPAPAPAGSTACTAGTAEALFARMGIDVDLTAGDLTVHSPIDGAVIGSVTTTDPAGVARAVAQATDVFARWREVPAPRRGEVVRRLGLELRRHKDDLGALVTLEAGKIVSEGRGEVQEMIDICDFATGLSRQLYGLTLATERAGHRLMEQWLPTGPVGIISAFNFPAAVWSWNATLALVCGDPVLWKPSHKTPLTAAATHALLERVLADTEPEFVGISSLVQGGRDVGGALVDDPRVPVVSATGSTEMGRDVGVRVARRFGHSILELGGNNAMIVTPSADLDLTLRAILFAAVGTCGQRCTSLRRIIVHRSVHDRLVDRLTAAYASIAIGDPRDEGTLVGPLIDRDALEGMQLALKEAAADGFTITGGERVLEDRFPAAAYVRPAIVLADRQTDLIRRETFAPLLYVLAYDDLDEAVAIHNDVPQGLASSIFTTDLREAYRFIGPSGSDCGIANVNVGPSGAEIGGAFGGEKATGGGRECGSDAWRGYMRRSTVTVNYSDALPLAQGVSFDIS